MRRSNNTTARETRIYQVAKMANDRAARRAKARRQEDKEETEKIWPNLRHLSMYVIYCLNPRRCAYTRSTERCVAGPGAGKKAPRRFCIKISSPPAPVVIHRYAGIPHNVLTAFTWHLTSRTHSSAHTYMHTRDTYIHARRHTRGTLDALRRWWSHSVLRHKTHADSRHSRYERSDERERDVRVSFLVILSWKRREKKSKKKNQEIPSRRVVTR